MIRIRYFIAILLVVLTGCVSEPEGENVADGNEAPDFTASVFCEGLFSDARSVTLSSLRGQPVLLLFFNTSCPDCREELPIVQQLYDIYSERMEFLCVARGESLESVKTYWIENGLTLPVSPQPDTKIYNLYAKSVIPRTYVLNAGGIITASFSDSPIADFATLSKIIESLLR